jgi:hypothetical protein
VSIRRGVGPALLAGFTLLALAALPFALVMVMYTPLIVGGESDPNHPLVLPATLLLLGIPLLILAGTGGAWIAWRQRRERVALLCAALPVVYGLLATSVVDSLRPVPPPEAPVAADEPLIMLSGDRDESRRPFELRSGQYTVRWTATLRPPEPSCSVFIRLRRVDNQLVLDSLVNLTLDRQWLPTASSETRLYGVRPGLYDLAVESATCDWSITLSPGAAAPTPGPRAQALDLAGVRTR